jgi:hypothetical protein
LIAVVARLILALLFARLEFALRLFLTLRRALTIDACFRLGLLGARRRCLCALAHAVPGWSKPMAGIGDAEPLLGRRNQAEIMLGMLKEAFGRDMITRCLRIPSQSCTVFFGNVLGPYHAL